MIMHLARETLKYYKWRKSIEIKSGIVVILGTSKYISLRYDGKEYDKSLFINFKLKLRLII